jgi:hypothetical protein
VNVGSDYVASTNGASASEQGSGSGASGVLGGGIDLVRSRPEVLVGAAFAGGVIAAFLLRRLGR